MIKNKSENQAKNFFLVYSVLVSFFSIIVFVFLDDILLPIESCRMTENLICSLIKRVIASAIPTPAAEIKLKEMAEIITASITIKSNLVDLCVSNLKFLISIILNPITIKTPASEEIGIHAMNGVRRRRIKREVKPLMILEIWVLPPL